jgi:hypothetical protein
MAGTLFRTWVVEFGDALYVEGDIHETVLLTHGAK